MTTLDQHPPVTGSTPVPDLTDVDPAVLSAVRAVPGWADRRFTATPVFGGLQNSNWWVRFEGEERQYFVKLPGAGTDAFIDRSNAHAAGTRAAAAGISPEIVAFSPDTGGEVVEYLDGYRACTNGDMKAWDVARSVTGLFRTFHTVEALPVTKTVFDMIDEHLAQVRELGVVLPPTAPALLREVGAARAALEASGLDLVPCHNDPMPGNFLPPRRIVEDRRAAQSRGVPSWTLSGRRTLAWSYS